MGREEMSKDKKLEKRREERNKKIRGRRKR
jgi:hypothetical protein